MRLIVLLISFFWGALAWASASFWHDKVTKSANLVSDTTVLTQESTHHARTLFLNETAFKTLLETAPMEGLNLTENDKQEGRLTIDLPLPDGGFSTLYVEESSVMAPALAEKFPNIRTWKVFGDNKKVRSGRIDFTSKGFHAMLTMMNGDTTYIDPTIEPAPVSTQQSYQSISLQKEAQKIPFKCNHDQIEENILQQSSPFSSLPFAKISALATSSGTIHSYRIAIAATSAFTVQNGGTKASALASIVTVINRVNEIYQRDVAIKLVLVANNDAIIYTNAASDPYGTNSLTNLYTNQTNLDNTIGNANYDIGHVFDFVSTTSATGLAQVSSVCDNSGKGRASSGFMSDLDSFATSMVAHEIGHQFGATHSFNSDTSFCNGNRSAASAYEPGGGTTIMSYAGVCGSANNVQNSNDPYFHSGSIQQMLQFAHAGSGSSCADSVFVANTDPVAEAGDSYTIPANTSFELQGSANDSNAEDYLSYSWEQLNTTSNASDVNVDDGANAIFRVYPPVASSTRTIPSLVNLYSGVTAKGDIPPQQSRLTTPLTMALFVRDQKTGTALDTTAIFVKNTGSSFTLTSHQTAAMLSAGDSTVVNWNVANTNQPPISCSAVDVSLIIGDPSRGDVPTEIMLLSGTNNDGNETVIIPTDTAPTRRARLKVKCSNNIFFALSPINFPIDDVVEGTTPVIFSAANASAVEGDSTTSATLKFTVVMSSVQPTEQTVFYTTFLSSPQSATATDFNHMGGSGLPIVFAAGETEKVVLLPLYGDNEIEPDETFRFILFKNGTIVDSAIGTILDDDTSPTPPSILSISDASITEGAEGVTVPLHFIVRLDNVQPHDVDVEYITSDNSALLSTSATAGADYTAKQGVLVIPAGQTQGVISIDVLGDNYAGGDEDFTLTLSSPSANAVLANKTAIGIIISDDGNESNNDDNANNEPILTLTPSAENNAGGGGSLNILLLGVLLMLACIRKLRKYDCS
ncbi:MAG TPA: hypothetical protein ENJ33_07200 [Thiothrix sp.]|nr:hypothetical protein [Thiothrix sp.]